MLGKRARGEGMSTEDNGRIMKITGRMIFDINRLCFRSSKGYKFTLDRYTKFPYNIRGSYMEVYDIVQVPCMCCCRYMSDTDTETATSNMCPCDIG